MQTTSATYDRILAGTDCSYEAQLVIDDVGTFGESDLMSISTSIEMFQEDPDIGKAIASEINVVMLNPVLPIPTMARIRPQVRAKGIAPKSSKVTIVDEDLASEYATYSSENITFNSSSGASVTGENLSFPVDSTEYLESEWLAQGIFYIDTREVTANNNGLDILTIHGFDAMLKTEQIYSSNASVGDNLDIAFVRAIADAIGVEVDPRTWGIMGTGYVIPFPVGYSMREILGYIASAYAGCFIISDTGQLRLVALEDIEDETRFLIDEIGEIIVFGVDSPEETVTASGAVATFTAGGEYDLDDLEIAIEPVQDLHGYDSPYPAGGGTNILPPTTISGSSHSVTVSTSNDEITINGTADAYGQVLANSTFILPSGTYYFKYFVVSGSGPVIPQIRSTAGTTTYVSGNNSFTLSEATEVKARVTYSNGSVFNNLKIKLMLSKGSTAPSEYADYSNICPISGWTGMDINNAPTVLSLEQGGIYDANGGEAGNANRIRTDFIPISALSKGTNIINLIQSDNVDVRKRYFYWYDANKTYIHDRNGTFNQVFPVELKRSYAPEGAEYLRIVLQNANGDIAITPTGYYLSINAKTIPISWQTEAGTVYKGTLNVLTGVLTVTWVSVTIDGVNKTVRTNGATSVVSNAWFEGATGKKYGQDNILSDKFIYRTGTQPFNMCGRSANIGVEFSLPPDVPQNNTALNAWFASNPTQLLYELDVPVTYQLDPHTVQTLVGQNNLWANTGNIINLEFTEPATEATRILV